LEQDYGNIEVVVTDDASTEPPICSGRSATRFAFRRIATGAGKPHGERLDLWFQGPIREVPAADDRLVPHRVSRMVEALGEHPSAGMLPTPH
jgi:hypothetical protein